ncbi:MAG: CRISPR-associated endonuclease Cas2 [Sulfuricaulis sp.]
MKDRNLYLAAYDIADSTRLRHALHAVKGFATGGQKSVFECFLSVGERGTLLSEVRGLLDSDEDAFILLRLDPRAKVIALGIGVAPDDPPFFYHG